MYTTGIVRAAARVSIFTLVASHVAAAAVIPIAEIAPELEPYAAGSPPVPPAALVGAWTGHAPDGSEVRVDVHKDGTTISSAAVGRHARASLRRASLNGRVLSFDVASPCPGKMAVRGAIRILTPVAAQLDLVRQDGSGQMSITLSRTG